MNDQKMISLKIQCMLTAVDYLYPNTTVKYKCFGQLHSFIFG